MTKDEALKLALDALETSMYPQQKQLQAITAIKESLANEALEKMAENARELGLDYEPAQEPVAWMNDSTPSGIFARHIDGARNFGCTIPLYTTPPQHTWVGLTDEDDIDWEDGGNLKDLVKAIEAKLRSKNESKN